MLKPILTEQSIKMAKAGRYTFAVAKSMRKPEIKKQVEQLFGVTVTETRTAIMPGKERRTGRRWKFVHNPDWKKAVVTLKSGQVIDLFQTN